MITSSEQMLNCFRVISTQKTQIVSDIFLPRRLAFVYDLEDALAELPTSVMRSKADCPIPPDVLKAGVSESVLARVNKVMTFYQRGKPLRRKKKEDGSDEQHGSHHSSQPEQHQQQPQPEFKKPEPVFAKPKAPVVSTEDDEYVIISKQYAYIIKYLLLSCRCKAV